MFPPSGEYTIGGVFLARGKALRPPSLFSKKAEEEVDFRGSPVQEQVPCFRAISLFLARKENLKNERGPFRGLRGRGRAFAFRGGKEALTTRR